MVSRALMILLAGLLGAHAQQDAVQEELKKFEGTWLVVGGQERGNEADLKELDLRFTFAGEKVTIKSTKFDRVTTLTFKLNPAKSPKEINLLSKDEEAVGIYALDGDMLKLCTSKDKANRPKEFVTTAENRFSLLVLKREKK